MRNVADEFIAEDIEQPFFTLIPSRFPTIDVFARVANDRSEALAEIESLTNPRLRERNRLMTAKLEPFAIHLPEPGRHAFLRRGSPRA
jgi:hypothetical protein